MSLGGRHIVVASGPTTEVTELDRVRVALMTNRSSGTFGALTAAMLLAAGAHVHYLHGRGAKLPGDEPILEAAGLRPPDLKGRPELTEFVGIEDLIAELEKRLTGLDVFATLMIVAGSDYRFGEIVRGGAPVRAGKVDSDFDDLAVSLVRVRKAIGEVKRLAPRTLLVGTKLEADVTEDELVRRAHARLALHRADLLVANTDEALRSADVDHYFVFPDGSCARHRGKVAAARELVRWLEEKGRG